MPLLRKSLIKAKAKTKDYFVSPMLTQKTIIDKDIKEDHNKKLQIPNNPELIKPLEDVAKNKSSLKDVFKAKLQNVFSTTNDKETEKIIDLTLSPPQDFHDKSKMNTIASPNLFTSEDEINLPHEKTSISDYLDQCVAQNVKLCESLFESNTPSSFREFGEMILTPDDSMSMSSSINSNLDECVLNNIRLSQELFKNNNLSQTMSNDKETKNNDKPERRAESHAKTTKSTEIGKHNQKVNKINKADKTNYSKKSGKSKNQDNTKEQTDNNKSKKKNESGKKEYTEKNKNKTSDYAKPITKKQKAIRTIAKKHTNKHETKEKNKKKFDLATIKKLQKERDVGLYVLCDTCNKTRYLPDCKDPLELPEKWYCFMNPDSNYNKCSHPDYKIDPEEKELIIDNKYNAGSIVWAKMANYPWWPAMVDDDPEIIDYFMFDNEDSLQPSWYHVVFFDMNKTTHAWIPNDCLEPFQKNIGNKSFLTRKSTPYKSRVTFAVKQAEKACKMKLIQRLENFSFLVRKIEEKKKKTRKLKG